MSMAAAEMERKNMAGSITKSAEKPLAVISRQPRYVYIVKYMSGFSVPVQVHADEDISREDVAAHVFLNSAYLSRLFRRKPTKSFIDYLTELKMIRAKELLGKTDSTVSGYAYFFVMVHKS